MRPVGAALIHAGGRTDGGTDRKTDEQPDVVSASESAVTAI